MSPRPLSPQDITAEVLARYDGCPDPRLRQLMRALVRHLHEFALEVEPSGQEWSAAQRILTESGQISTEIRQEFTLWSDALGLSMLVDAIAHPKPPGATESTVLGPFYAAGSPERSYGERMFEEEPIGVPVLVHGCVSSIDGRPIAGALLDVWQNDADQLYAVQKPEGPEHHLRGKYRSREDGSYAFIGVRPTPYPIPDDGPVGRMLIATGRHPWRPAHIHMIVSAEGFESVTTHIFDAESQYLDADAVFAVKPSLLRSFVARGAQGARPPEGLGDYRYSVENNLVLVPVTG